MSDNLEYELSDDKVVFSDEEQAEQAYEMFKAAEHHEGNIMTGGFTVDEQWYERDSDTIYVNPEASEYSKAKRTMEEVMKSYNKTGSIEETKELLE